ncbi:hypothetical protein GCM10027521_60190 [Amycolatopsis cihanbeyliensis]
MLSGSRIFAKETRVGAPGIPVDVDAEVVAAVAWFAGETAKMRPSGDIAVAQPR